MNLTSFWRHVILSRLCASDELSRSLSLSSSSICVFCRFIVCSSSSRVEIKRLPNSRHMKCCYQLLLKWFSAAALLLLLKTLTLPAKWKVDHETLTCIYSGERREGIRQEGPKPVWSLGNFRSNFSLSPARVALGDLVMRLCQRPCGSQWELTLKGNSLKRGKKRVATGFIFVSDWWRRWGNFPKPITDRVGAKPFQSWITFNTLKSVLKT